MTIEDRYVEVDQFRGEGHELRHRTCSKFHNEIPTFFVPEAPEGLDERYEPRAARANPQHANSVYGSAPRLGDQRTGDE